MILCMYIFVYIREIIFAYILEAIFMYIGEAVFVYIREPFSFRPTFCEDFRFDVPLCSYVRTRMCTKTRIHKKLLTHIRILGQEMALAKKGRTDVHEKRTYIRILGLEAMLALD